MTWRGGTRCRAPCLAGPGLLRPGPQSAQMRQGGQPGTGRTFPDREDELLKLPGIGPYTAAAIAAIAFDRQATVMDGNVERAIARLHAVATPLPAAKPELRRLAAALTPAERPGDYAQAIMDLGATVCTPRKPRCMLCPWRALPRPSQRHSGDLAAKSPKPSGRSGMPWCSGYRAATAPCCCAAGPRGVSRRPVRSAVDAMARGAVERRGGAGVGTRARLAIARRRGPPWLHAFRSRAVGACGQPRGAASKGVWCPVDRLSDYALPTLMKKVVRHALAKL